MSLTTQRAVELPDTNFSTYASAKSFGRIPLRIGAFQCIIGQVLSRTVCVRLCCVSFSEHAVHGRVYP